MLEYTDMANIKKAPIPDLTAAEAVRFWAKIDKSGYDKGSYHSWNGTPCWTWTAVRTKGKWGGYGLFTADRRQLRASRIMFKIHNGCDPGDNQVCHHCNYPPCLNPLHIYEGDDTGKINLQQAASDLRVRNQVSFHQYTDREIEAIRELADKGIPVQEIAAQYGEKPDRIRGFISGKSRTLAPGKTIPPNPNWHYQSNNPAAQLTEASIPTIWVFFLDDLLPKVEIGDILDVSHAAIRSILRGKTWIDASTAFLATRNLSLIEGVALAYQIRSVSRKRNRVY